LFTVFVHQENHEVDILEGEQVNYLQDGKIKLEAYLWINKGHCNTSVIIGWEIRWEPVIRTTLGAWLKLGRWSKLFGQWLFSWCPGTSYRWGIGWGLLSCRKEWSEKRRNETRKTSVAAGAPWVWFLYSTWAELSP